MWLRILQILVPNGGLKVAALSRYSRACGWSFYGSACYGELVRDMCGFFQWPLHLLMDSGFPRDAATSPFGEWTFSM